MGCSCSKKAQPTGFAKTSATVERTGAQAAQRAGAASVPGAVSAPLRSIPPTGAAARAI